MDKKSRKQILIRKPDWIIDPHIPGFSKSRFDGESTLEMLSMTAHKASIWLYVDDVQDWSDLTFYEHSTSEAETASAMFSFDLTNIKSASLYNVHTREHELRIFQHFLNPNEYTSDELRHFAAVEVSFPSRSNMFSYADILRRNEGVNFDFRIVSAHGVLTIKHKEFVNGKRAAEIYSDVWKDGTPMQIAENSSDKSIETMLQNVTGYFNRKLDGYAQMNYRSGLGFSQESDSTPLNVLGDSIKN